MNISRKLLFINNRTGKIIAKEVSEKTYLIILLETAMLLLMISFEIGKIDFYQKNVELQKVFISKLLFLIGLFLT